MHANFSPLAAEPEFRERAAALAASAPRGQVAPLDGMFEHFRRFTAVRSREALLARLRKAERSSAAAWAANRARVPDAVKGFSEALKTLSEQASSLQGLISPALDEVMGLAADGGHPLRTMLHETALSLGFSNDEAEWLFAELKAIGFRPVELVCANGFDDFEILLACISAGENGLLLAGFPRFTGDPETDERLENLVIRLLDKGVTASIFLALTIFLTAYAVAATQAKGG